MVSVIIPAYNPDLSLLEKCINSVLDQTYGDFECILVDDGSDEEHAEAMENYRGKDQRIRVFHKKNGGSGNTRNYGVERAAGEWVFFLDSDDYISPYALENGISISKQFSADMIVGVIQHVTYSENLVFQSKEDKTIIVHGKKEKQEFFMHVLGYKSRRFRLNNGSAGPSACSKLVRKEIMERAPFENDKYWNEDNLWNISVIAFCNTIVVVDNLWYAYVINQNSMIRAYCGSRLYEFQFRAKQEYDRTKKLWQDCMQGAYHSIWAGLLCFCRTDVFHAGNPKSGKERYKDFLAGIDFDEFRETIRNISFDYEPRFVYRMIKIIIKKMLLHNKKLAYLTLGVCNSKIRF